MTERPVTIKIGGVAGQHADSLAWLAGNAPASTVIVHGGGNEVAEWSRRLGLEPRTHDGLRVTDPDTLEVVVAVLAGLVNSRLVAALEAEGRSAVGLTGADGALLRLRRRPSELGEVGEVLGADASLLDTLLASHRLPVVASIGLHEGALLNVNADEVAGAIAAARGGLLLLCTDVPGVQRDGQLLDRLDASAAEAMLADGSASAGMRPKLRAALVAAAAGCEVRIVDGRSVSALEAAFGGGSAGTRVTAA
ncbi:MAG TPA: acetylglutamate kinase [Candidatus Limnocylindria bacterium]|nr:acetylglutamate kinase [Candidatus Limnocylindria bacterium]